MDFYQGIVVEYLRARRSVFVNTEFCIQLEEAENPDKVTHWYCDIVAVDFKQSAVFLCEVSYSKSLQSLLGRLDAWSANWSKVQAGVARDASVPSTWPMRPWVFTPNERRPVLAKGLAALNKKHGAAPQMPEPLVTDLEDVVPWKYRSWNRKGDDA